MATRPASSTIFTKSIGKFSFYSLNISLSFSEGLARPILGSGFFLRQILICILICIFLGRASC